MNILLRLSTNKKKKSIRPYLGEQQKKMKTSNSSHTLMFSLLCSPLFSSISFQKWWGQGIPKQCIQILMPFPSFCYWWWWCVLGGVAITTAF